MSRDAPFSETRAPLLSVALVSATALAYEILLVRLFSIVQWHHFAYMVISLALLGYGASGTFLMLSRRWLRDRFAAAYLVNLFLFPVAALVCFVIAQQVQFNAERLLWDVNQWWRLLAVYLLLALPFLFVANAIGLAFMRFPARLAAIYGADLLGAGAGGVVIVGLLYLLFPMNALRLLVLLGLLALLVARRELGVSGRGWRGVILAVAVVIAVLPGDWLVATPSPYKGLSQQLEIPETRVTAEYSSPLGFVSVLESPRVPLRHAPGLSLMSPHGPPDQVGLYVDGEGPVAVDRAAGGSDAAAYLDFLTSAAPYAVVSRPRVLVLGAGGGGPVRQALAHEARHVDAVELNPQVVHLVNDDFASWSGDLYGAPEVTVHTREARGFVKGVAAPYDVIQIPPLDSFRGTSAGLRALSENYLYTVEALTDYLDALADNGVVAITRWVRMPPRDGLKLFATAVQALERQGVEDPGAQLVLIRTWQTSTLLMRKGAFSRDEMARLRTFCSSRAFDIAFGPGIGEQDANRYNRLREPLFHQAATALAGEQRDVFMAAYKYQLSPATDDRPYFFHFFRWASLEELLALWEQGGATLADAGYLVLLATLVQALLVSLLLILLPLLVMGRGDRKDRPVAPARVLLYFAALGLAFLFMEIAMIQKLIQFLHHPLYAVAVVLAAFLVFAGLGSRTVGGSARTGIGGSVAGIAVLAGAYLLGLDPVFAALAGLAEPARIPVAILLVAPLAFLMGMPFPSGLSRLSDLDAELIPWAWGINGCASVISAGAATLTAVHFGFSVVVMMAVALYGVAVLSYPRPRHG